MADKYQPLSRFTNCCWSEDPENAVIAGVLVPAPTGLSPSNDRWLRSADDSSIARVDADSIESEQSVDNDRITFLRLNARARGFVFQGDSSAEVDELLEGSRPIPDVLPASGGGVGRPGIPGTGVPGTSPTVPKTPFCITTVTTCPATSTAACGI